MSLYKHQIKSVSTLKTHELKEWIAEQDEIHPGIQSRLIKHPHRTVQSEISKHPSLLVRFQEELLSGGNHNVIMTLVVNPSLDPSVARKIVESEKGEVLERFAERGVIPDEMRKELAEGQHPGLLAGFAARNDLTHDEIGSIYSLGREARAPQDVLLRQAWLPPAVVNSALDAWDVEKFELMARNPHLSDEVALKIIPVSSSIQASLAWRQNLSEQLGNELAKIVEGSALSFLANNRSLSTHLETVVRRGDPRIAAIVTSRPDCPDPLKEEALDGKFGPEAKLRLLSHGYTKADRLRQLFKGSTLDEKLQMAINPNLPVDLQKELAKIEDPLQLSARLAANVNLEFFDELPGRVFRHRLRQMSAEDFDADPEVWAVLAPTWVGTLGELKLACREFAKSN